jgi:hypothetical protein
LGTCNGKILKETLPDDSYMNKQMVRADLSDYVFSITFCLPVEILISLATPQRCHIAHPEMIGVSADGSYGLLESNFDFKPKPVESDNSNGLKGKVGGHKDTLSSSGMHDNDEANENANGSPEQVDRTKMDGDILFSVDRALCGLHGILV